LALRIENSRRQEKGMPAMKLSVLLVLVTPCVVLGGGAETKAAESKRPNIAFIFSDDHAYQAISAYGSKLNKTPNIDRAKEGIPERRS
jgi:hypothetical protein